MGFGACGPDDGVDPADCEGLPVASFRVVIVAPGSRLPADTVLRVKYGGGEEEYRLADPQTPDVVFCRHAIADGGLLSKDASVGDGGESDAGVSLSSVEALSCKLWTNGAATATVQASGYEELVAELEAEIDDKCDEIVTKDVMLELVAGDGGTR